MTRRLEGESYQAYIERVRGLMASRPKATILAPDLCRCVRCGRDYPPLDWDEGSPRYHVCDWCWDDVTKKGAFLRPKEFLSEGRGKA